ncbi:hypothetical protein Tco_0739353 [Tanacetum coccineum]
MDAHGYFITESRFGFYGNMYFWCGDEWDWGRQVLLLVKVGMGICDGVLNGHGGEWVVDGVEGCLIRQEYMCLTGRELLSALEYIYGVWRSGQRRGKCTARKAAITYHTMQQSGELLAEPPIGIKNDANSQNLIISRRIELHSMDKRRSEQWNQTEKHRGPSKCANGFLVPSKGNEMTKSIGISLSKCNSTTVQQQQVHRTFVEPFNLVKPINNQAPPVVTMADNRTMTQLLEAPTEGYEDAIVVPEITRRTT